RSGEKLADRVHDQLSDIAARPELVRSLLQASKCRLYF
ncbi:IS630 family transposase, partial [Xanthomonas oryzae pv. oryzae]